MKNGTGIFLMVTLSFMAVDYAIWIVMIFISMGCSNDGYKLCQTCFDTSISFNSGQGYPGTFFSPVPIVFGGIAISGFSMITLFAVDVQKRIIERDPTGKSGKEKFTIAQKVALLIFPILSIIEIVLMVGLAAGNKSITNWVNYVPTLALTCAWAFMTLIRAVFQISWVSTRIYRDNHPKKGVKKSGK